MRISNSDSPSIASITPTSHLEPIESKTVILAEKLSSLTTLEGFADQIVIKGDLSICSSNAYSLILLKSKEVELEGSLTYSGVFFSHIFDKYKKDFEEEVFCFLPQKFKVKGNMHFSSISRPFSLPESLEVEGDLIIYDCKALAPLPKGLKAGSLKLSEETPLGTALQNLNLNQSPSLFVNAAPPTVSKDLQLIEPRRILLAKELDSLKTLEGLTDQIVIKGDVSINSFNAHSFILLKSKEVEIHGSLSFRGLFFSLIFDKYKKDFEEEAFCFLPQKLKVMGNVVFDSISEPFSLPEQFEIGRTLTIHHCKALAPLPKGLKARFLNLYENIPFTNAPKSLLFSTLSVNTAPKTASKILLAKELDSLTTLEGFTDQIVIKGDLFVNPFNLHSLILLKSKEVELDGSLNANSLFFFHIFDKYKKDFEEEVFCFLPQKLKVKGNVDFSSISEPFSLPENLHVKGNLNLSSCHALTSLPKGLQVDGNLNLSSCHALTSLPEDLQVRGHLDLSSCHALTSLPENLQVKGYLDLSSCHALTRLSEDLQVEKSLNLNGCTGLTFLPEKLEVGENLDCRLCESLITIPKDLHVKGNLVLSGCIALTALPEGLQIGGNLDLSRCAALTGLHEPIKLGGHLNLERCSNITALPNWIGELGPCSDESVRNVYLTESGISYAIIARLQETTRGRNGIQIYFSMSDPKNYNTYFDNFSSALQFWQKQGEDISIDCEKICHQLEQSSLSLQDHQNLLHFLQRLTGTRDFQNQVTKGALARRVLHMLQLMSENEEFFHHSTFLIHQGLSSCDDRVMATLDDLGLYQKLQILQQASITSEELKHAGRGFFLLEQLNKKIAQYVKTLHFVDEVEVYMAFHIRLQKILNLPLDTKDMLFRRCVSTSDEEIERIGNGILQEMTESAFETFLMSWDPWKKHQRRASVFSWDLLPVSNRLLLSTDICPYLQDTPDQAVIYNNVVYDYEAFIQRYIEEGVDTYHTPIEMHQLFRMNVS